MYLEEAFKAMRSGATIQRAGWGIWLTLTSNGLTVTGQGELGLSGVPDYFTLQHDDFTAGDWRAQEALRTDRSPTPMERDQALDFATRVGRWRGGRLTLASDIAQLLADDRVRYCAGEIPYP